MSTLAFGFLFGTIGVGYFIYGKKQQRMIPLVAGMGLCVFPYFLHNIYAVLILGAILTIAPWLIRE